MSAQHSEAMKRNLYERPEAEEIVFQFEDLVLYGTGTDWGEDEEVLGEDESDVYGRSIF